MNDRVLVFSASDGLGNRLRALCGFRALSLLQGTQLLLHWEQSGACDAGFTELFDMTGWEDVRLLDAEEAAAWKARCPAQFHQSSAWFSEIWRQHAQSICSREEFSRIAVESLRALHPTAPLRSRIDTFAGANGLAGCVGMHIRMTDNVQSYEWWARNSPDFAPDRVSRLEGFTKAIRELASRGTRVFVCTDNRDIVRQLESAFDNLVMMPKDFDERGLNRHLRDSAQAPGRLSRLGDRMKAAFGLQAPTSWRTTPVGDALVEMWLLGRCSRVIGTYFSSFSQVSALLGGVKHYRVEGTEVVENTFIADLLAALDDGAAVNPLDEAAMMQSLIRQDGLDVKR